MEGTGCSHPRGNQVDGEDGGDLCALGAFHRAGCRGKIALAGAPVHASGCQGSVKLKANRAEMTLWLFMASPFRYILVKSFTQAEPLKVITFHISWLLKGQVSIGAGLVIQRNHGLGCAMLPHEGAFGSPWPSTPSTPLFWWGTCWKTRFPIANAFLGTVIVMMILLSRCLDWGVWVHPVLFGSF